MLLLAVCFESHAYSNIFEVAIPPKAFLGENAVDRLVVSSIHVLKALFKGIVCLMVLFRSVWHAFLLSHACY